MSIRNIHYHLHTLNRTRDKKICWITVFELFIVINGNTYNLNICGALAPPPIPFPPTQKKTKWR